jgi:AcrR family transcriptional regulator
MAQTTRERILAATTELIRERGFGNVSTRAIADRAEVNPALPNYYFGTKEALLVEAATEALLNELDQPELAPSTPLEAVEAVRALARLDRESIGAAATLELGVESLRNERIRKAAADVLARFRDAATESLGGDREARGLATLYAALLDGLALHLLIDDELDLDAAAQALSGLLGDHGSRG